jgi:succinyl-diaminopimelate desuccinylase
MTATPDPLTGHSPAAPAPTFAARVLIDLVSIPSVNPGTSEAAVAHRIVDWLAPTDAEIDLVETFPGRPSVAAILRGRGGGPRLVLNGHMDTVPVDDEKRWTSDPFAAQVRDGHLYGRGACDMKAGLAAQIAVAHALANRAGTMRGDLVLHFAVGEECGEPGTLSLCRAGHVGDVGIVTEPTQLQVSVATRGLAMIQIRIKGRSIHASRAVQGINPVTRLAPVLDALRRYEDVVSANVHPLLGSGSCTPTMVHGGVKTNAVADVCDLYLDRRLVPGETVNAALDAIRRHLDPLRTHDPDFDYELTCAPYPFEAAELPSDSLFARQLQQTTTRVLGTTAPIIGTPFASDVRNLVNDAGIEAVTFGPGNVAECHCVDERVSLQQLNDAVAVISTIATELLC